VVGRKKERFRAKRADFCLQARNTNYVPVGTVAFSCISTYRCACRDVIRITSRQVKKAQNPVNLAANHTNYAIMPRLLSFAQLYKNEEYITCFTCSDP
jgi:hypothetical protein